MNAGPMMWGAQQSAALQGVSGWYSRCRAEMARGERLSKPFYCVFGFAGTGKTSLAKSFAEGVRNPVFGAFTGKAALMMARAGCAGAATLHSILYTPIEDSDGSVRFVRNEDGPMSEADLLICDEVSMVGEDMARDILSFGVPVLVLGDPAQLPPVKGKGYFINRQPDNMLTEIHRQARDNPIIRLATSVRTGNALELGEYGHSRVVRQGVLTDDEVTRSGQVICGTHRTRKALITKFRRLLACDGPYPEAGERLVCRQNDKKAGILNGGLFTVVSVRPGRKKIRMEVESIDFPERGIIEVASYLALFTGWFDDMSERERFDALRGTQVFDFGYALTCHVAQGSQWDDVVIYDESRVFREDWSRWLYTAITRAADRVTVVQMGGGS